MRFVLFAAGVVVALGFAVSERSTDAAFPGFNGDIAYVDAGDSGSAIWRMNSDGTNPLKIADSDAHENWPAWSPDGTRIAFTSERDGNREIYVMNADGSGQTNLTNDPASDFDASWTPDGEQLIFRSARSTGNAIWIMDADGSNQTTLLNIAGTEAGPVFSPDGAHITFVNDNGGNYDLYVADADGTDVQQLTTTDVHEGNPDWSPDGQQIVFVRARSVGPAAAGLSGDTDIWTIDVDGSNESQLTNDGTGDYNPAWSPDGEMILFETTRDTDGLHTMNTDGSDVQFIREGYLGDWQSIEAGTQVWGDADCSSGVDPVDSLKTLRFDAGLSVAAADGCPVLGSSVQADGVERTWGDVDCFDSVDPVDSLKILRYDAGLSVAKPEGCPAIGDSAVIA